MLEVTQIQTRPKGIAFRRSRIGDHRPLAALAVQAAAGSSSPGSGSVGSLGAEDRSCVAVEAETGRVLAHVGGRDRWIRWRGERRASIECVDEVLDPTLISGPRSSAIRLGLRRFWMDELSSSYRSALVWGVFDREKGPTGVGVSPVEEICDVELVGLDQGSRLSLRRSRLSVARRGRLPADIDSLWANLEPEVEFGVVRDREYLATRYAPATGTRYTWLTARDPVTGVLRGAAVIRVGGLRPDAVMLMEWLVPAADEESARAVLDGAQRFVRRFQLGPLIAWTPRHATYREGFFKMGFEPWACELVVAGRCGDPAVTRGALRDGWFLSLGDLGGY